MENNVNLASEQTETGSHSPINGFAFQQANEERFNHLQTEMSTLKAMMERLIQQNEEKERQADASATTSSFADSRFLSKVSIVFTLDIYSSTFWENNFQVNASWYLLRNWLEIVMD